MEVREHARSYEESYSKGQWNSKAARKLKGVTGGLHAWGNVPRWCVSQIFLVERRKGHTTSCVKRISRWQHKRNHHRRAVIRNTERHAQYQRGLQSAPRGICAAHGQPGACRHAQLYLPHDQGVGAAKHPACCVPGVMGHLTWARRSKTAWEAWGGAEALVGGPSSVDLLGQSNAVLLAAVTTSW